MEMVRVVRLARVVDGHGCELSKSANEEMVYWSCGLVWCSVVWCGLVLIDGWMGMVLVSTGRLLRAPLMLVSLVCA